MRDWIRVVSVLTFMAVFLGVLVRIDPVLAGTWDLALGWDFECHSHTHPSLVGLTESQIRWELEQVNTAFTTHGYAPPQHHAYPYGDYDASVEKIVSQLRKTGRTVWGEMMTYPVTDWYEMMSAQLVSTTTFGEISTWIDSCITKRALLHIFTHDVSSTPSPWGCTPAMLVRLLDYLVQKQNAGQLAVMTMAEAYDYWSSTTGGRAVVVVSFDDANESDYTFVYPLFKARGLKGTSYIVTSFIGDSGSLTWDEIAKMRADGKSWAVHLESKENSGATLNLGTITFSGISHGLPDDVVATAGNHQTQYFSSSGYVFDHWETTGGVTVLSTTSNPTTATVNGIGTLRPVYRASASVLFDDDFEYRNFNAWTGTSLSLGETASVVNTRAHHGTYSARFGSNGDGGTEYAYCYKTLGSSPELYAQGYFYVSRSGIADNTDSFYLIVFKAGSNVAYAGWRKTGGVVRWTLVVRDGTKYVYSYSSTSPAMNKWYCVELHWKKGTTNGLGELWVDGQKACSITLQNTAYYGNVRQVRFGIPQITNCGRTIVYLDCAVVAENYIHPET